MEKTMKKEQENRTRWLNIRLKPDEYKTLEARFKKTMLRKMSEYSRYVLLEKTVTVIYRDRSMDEVLEQLILLRKELNFIGNNFNQAVRKLNSVAGMPEAYLWQAMLEILRDKLEPAIGQNNGRIADYSDIWSQRLSAGKG
jgi:hypothetical protein